MISTSTGTRAGGVVRADAGRTLMEGPLGAVLLAGPEAAGGLAFVVHPMAPRTLGSPVHTHRREDEFTFVLTGEVGVQVGHEVVTARPGDLVLKPRGVPHAFWNATDEPARLLEVITPGGFEGYFSALAEVLAVEGPPDLARLYEVARRFGLDIDPASIPRLVETHGLAL